MKKIFTIVTIITLTLGTLFNANVIEAASGNISISGNSNVEVGSEFTITVSYSASEDSVYDFTVSGSGSISGGGKHTADTKGSVSFKFKANSTGPGTITVSGNGAIITPPFSKFVLSGSKTINVNAPYVPPVKTPEQIAAEKAAAEKAEAAKKAAAEKAEAERKEAEEKERLASLERTPMFKNIEIVSNSVKQKDQVVGTIATEESVFEYEYTLPKRVNEFNLSLTGENENAVLTYEVSHKLEEEENEKVIEFYTTEADIVQNYKLTVKRDLTEDVVVKVDDSEFTVYIDKLLNTRMEELGFTINPIDINGLTTQTYSLGDVKIQLLVDKDDNAKWYVLDENNLPKEEVVLLLNEDKKPFFVVESTDEELLKKTLHGEKYTGHSNEGNTFFTEIDAGLKFKSDFSGWKFEEGKVVYGYTSEGVAGIYYLDATNNAIKAIVAFDAAGNNTMKTIAIASSVALVLVSAYAVYVTMILKRKENINK